jgi:hypothetical protein
MENTMNDFSRSNSLADLAAKASAEHEAIAAAMKRGLEHALTAGADDHGCNDALVTARNTLTSALYVAGVA